MVNRKVCLVLLSLVIIILFVVSVFLMTMVDPDPVVSPATTKSPGRRRLKGKKVKDAYDVVFPQFAGKLSYGLPKVSENQKIKGGVVDETVSLYRNLAANGLLVNSSEVQVVVSPIKLPTIENQNTTVSERIELSPVKITIPSVKINDLGHSRIEIKLEPKRAFEDKRRYYRRFANNTSNIHPESENIKEFDGEKETFIKILNNNTLIINDPEEFQNTNESDIIYLKNSLFGKNSTKANNYKEITIMISNAEHKNDSTSGVSGSLLDNTRLLHFDKLLDNTTRSNDLSINSNGIITNITSNRSNETNPSLIVMNENDSVFKHVKNVEEELINESTLSATSTAKTYISVV